ncbi:MAG: NAD(P)-dependent oxidoreductase [Pseudorhodoplanes sp.]
MRSLFIDCNHQLEPIFHRVHRPDDPPVTIHTAPWQAEDLPRLLDGYEICLDDHSYLPTEWIARCPSLRHVVFLGTGAASYMDVAALQARGVAVHTIRGYGDTAVAEHTIALMFACARDIARMDRAIRADAWKPLEGLQLQGKTLGLIGLGGIGREVARIATGIGMKVVGWNRTMLENPPVPMLALDALLSSADVISLHLALSDETRHFLDAERIGRLRPGAILINTARGGLIDEAALLRALESRQIGHAGLDVFDIEPLRGDHPFCRLENVTLTAHSAYRTVEASMTLLRRGIDIVRKIRR